MTALPDEAHQPSPFSEMVDANPFGLSVEGTARELVPTPAVALRTGAGA